MCSRSSRWGWTAKPSHTGSSSARDPSAKSMRPVIRCLDRKALALWGVSRGGIHRHRHRRHVLAEFGQRALDLLRLGRARVLAGGVEEGHDRRPAAQLRAWSRAPRPGRAALKSGARRPAGKVAPSKRRGPSEAASSLPAGAARTTAPRAKAATSMRAISHARVHPWQGSAGSLGLYEASADRVAHQLHAVAHAQLGQHVGPVGLHRLLGQVEGLGDLAVGVGLGDQLRDLELARA